MVLHFEPHTIFYAAICVVYITQIEMFVFVKHEYLFKVKELRENLGRETVKI